MALVVLEEERAIERLRALADLAVDTVYPKRCASCGRRGDWLCPACDESLVRFHEPWCSRCGVPLSFPICKCDEMPDVLESVRSVGPFEQWLRGAVVQFKYHGEWGRAAHLGPMLAHVACSLSNVQALVPVPLHPARMRQRGFNQSHQLAQEVGRLLDLPVEDALTRTRRTQPQVRLGADERSSNVAGAFVVRPGHDFTGRSILIVDDVITTGSTLTACAVALREAGARPVSAATVAREM